MRASQGFTAKEIHDELNRNDDHHGDGAADDQDD